MSLLRALPTLLIFLLAAYSLRGAVASVAPEKSAPRERLSLDEGWRFHLGDEWPGALRLDKARCSGGPAAQNFDDSAWRKLRLPHDWAVELPFDPAADRNHGYKALGPAYLSNSVAWYRRHFRLPIQSPAMRVRLIFDGIFRDSTVWVNGWLVRRHESGYAPLAEDITAVLNPGGDNTISVRVDATGSEGWFYEGAGIYRHVWLEKTHALAVAPNSVFVYSEFQDKSPEGPALLNLSASVRNAGAEQAEGEINWTVLDPNGQVLAGVGCSDRGILTDGADVELHGTAQVKNPQLWSPESPVLYTLVTTLTAGGRTVDRIETPFGIRTVAFDPELGFLLNGKRYEIHGTCNHQDHAGVGVAVPDALHEFRVRKLKEMGCNAYRMSHNAPTPELLDCCDRLGMLVMDENRLLGADSRNRQLWADQIRRNRNHPSVAIWCIANEEQEVHDTPQARRVAEEMQALAKRLDPTRPVTYAANEENVATGINAVIEVRGWNYHLGPHVDTYHAEHPSQPCIGTEQASVVGTRGIYANNYEKGQVSAYDVEWPGWDTTAESWWTFFAKRQWLSGAFAWTGFDYRGEPSPCNWPSISSHFGIMDTCGFPKDSYYYYKSWWTTAPVLHIAPHWNWPGKEGMPIAVQIFSNCAEVELFLNGQSLGRKPMHRNSKLVWSQVPYSPGVLLAAGYDEKGAKVIESAVETTAQASRLVLGTERKSIKADGRDLAVITVSAIDANGRRVPLAQDKVRFTLEGEGRILGVGNGDPNCHEPDVFIEEGAQWSRSLFNGLAQVILQSGHREGRLTLCASADGLEPARLSLDLDLAATPPPTSVP